METYPTPHTHPTLRWQRLAAAPHVVFAITPLEDATVMINAWNERTGSSWAKRCSRPHLAGQWVMQFARLHG